ncbi:MAG: SCO family protein [Bryobacteraceae bacterium]|nr:SCO family protein [Bryobacteraceae bacterium]
MRFPLVVLAATVLAATALLQTGCGFGPGMLGPGMPSYGIVPDFRLTRENGTPVTQADLAGKVWLANFIFTTCAGPCPRMTAQFRKVQQDAGPERDLRFVSFTIDPGRDTPEVLAAYARRFKADPERWMFLTGPASELNKLSSGPFHAGAIDGSLSHSTRFGLVDRKGRIRGYYDSSDAEMMRQMLLDIKTLVSSSV